MENDNKNQRNMINIAKILKDYPKGTKLWNNLFGECTLVSILLPNEINNYGYIYVLCGETNVCFSNFGELLEGSGICSLFPSKEMRDWEKFAWKKGDVLRCGVDNLCIFDCWANYDYTEFYGRYNSPDYRREYEKLDAECWIYVGGKMKTDFIERIEDSYGGVINLSTLEIEKHPEFKDGDILYYPADNAIFIAKVEKKGVLHCYIYMSKDEMTPLATTSFHISCEVDTPRPATDFEKQLLFDTLAKEGKMWDATNKQIVDLPKKCEFKPFQKVLVRDADDETWIANFFSHYNEDSASSYVCVSCDWRQCIPYEGNEHLLGTTDEWKGGEV